MIPGAFEYYAPTSIRETLDLLARHGEDAKILSGGQSLIQASRSRKVEWKTAEPVAAVGAIEARDPVCGMSVTVASAKYRSERFGKSFYFCCHGCQQTFDRDPQRYLAD